MAWTDKQQEAIYTRGSNIVVSAGAGSGKTAVLSERMLDFCLKGNDITEALVLTFTNAAAKEMVGFRETIYPDPARHVIYLEKYEKYLRLIGA